MNYWQFKFRNEETSFQELATLKDGDIFFTEITEDHILKKLALDTIVFWDRIDKEKGILLVAKIIGYPYKSDELASGKAIPMKVVKKFTKPFILERNGFKKLHEHLNTTIHKGRVRSRVNIGSIKNLALDTGKRLYKRILDGQFEPKPNLININEKKIKGTLKIFLDNYTKYMKDGKNGCYYNVFMEANIAKQEIRHSSFLANIFNKDGNHFHGNLFFKNFINELKQHEVLLQCEAISKFDIENYSVKTEEYDDTKAKKGFMDIVIEDKDYMIIIENKTGTEDHTGQLIRYKEYAESKSKKDYIVLYLTPKGKAPTDSDAQQDKKIISISSIDDVYKAIKNSIDDIENETLKDIIIQYYKSIKLYANDLPINWEYELDTINTITQDYDTFKNCESITQLVNYNIISEYNFSNEEIEIAKWISKYFIKSKAKIERNFTQELINTFINEFNSKDFIFNEYFTDIDLKSDDLLIYNDINIINNARYNRLAFKKEREDKSHRIVIVFSKYINNKQILLNFTNYVGGLEFIVGRADMDNIFEEQGSIYLESFETFNSKNISNLLYKENRKKIIQECKIKVLAELKKMDI